MACPRSLLLLAHIEPIRLAAYQAFHSEFQFLLDWNQIASSILKGFQMPIGVLEIVHLAYWGICHVTHIDCDIKCNGPLLWDRESRHQNYSLTINNTHLILCSLMISLVDHTTAVLLASAADCSCISEKRLAQKTPLWLAKVSQQVITRVLWSEWSCK